MPANVESMFYVRQAPWHGLGVRVEEAPSSQEALRLSGLDWQVIQQPIATVDGTPIPGYRANLRDTDQQVLGVVTDRYRVVQNEEAFAFTDGLLEHFTRREAHRKLASLGAIPDRNVTQKTDLLICGEKPGVKLIQAKVKGLPILTEQQFLEILSM